MESSSKKRNASVQTSLGWFLNGVRILYLPRKTAVDSLPFDLSAKSWVGPEQDQLPFANLGIKKTSANYMLRKKRGLNSIYSIGFLHFFHPQWYPNGNIPRFFPHHAQLVPPQDTGSISRSGGRRSWCETPPRYSSSGRSTARDLSFRIRHWSGHTVDGRNPAPPWMVET